MSGERIVIVCGEFTIPPPRSKIPPPTWTAFGKCPQCGTLAGEPCYDLRDVNAGKPPEECRVVNNAHRGRRQVGPIRRRGGYL